MKNLYTSLIAIALTLSLLSCTDYIVDVPQPLCNECGYCTMTLTVLRCAGFEPNVNTKVTAYDANGVDVLGGEFFFEDGIFTFNIDCCLLSQVTFNFTIPGDRNCGGSGHTGYYEVKLVNVGAITYCQESRQACPVLVQCN